MKPIPIVMYMLYSWITPMNCSVEKMVEQVSSLLWALTQRARNAPIQTVEVLSDISRQRPAHSLMILATSLSLTCPTIRLSAASQPQILMNLMESIISVVIFTRWSFSKFASTSSLPFARPSQIWKGIRIIGTQRQMMPSAPSRYTITAKNEAQAMGAMARPKKKGAFIQRRLKSLESMLETLPSSSLSAVCWVRVTIRLKMREMRALLTLPEMMGPSQKLLWWTADWKYKAREMTAARMQAREQCLFSRAMKSCWTTMVTAILMARVKKYRNQMNQKSLLILRYSAEQMSPIFTSFPNPPSPSSSSSNSPATTEASSQGLMLGMSARVTGLGGVEEMRALIRRQALRA